MNVIIPAKGTSTRIPGKNIKDFHGKPIIAYSIDLMKHYPGVRDVVVSTESRVVADIAKEYGAVPLRRPKRLCEDNVGTQEVARHVLSNLKVSHPYTMVLYATSPLIKLPDVVLAMIRLYESPTNAYVYCVDFDRNDTGSFYIGHTESFLAGTPLEGNSTTIYVEDIDINTPSDWELAEQLFEEQQNEQAAD